MRTAAARPPKNTPSADAAKSAIEGCLPGEKYWRYSRMPAYMQNNPRVRTAVRRPYPGIARLTDPAQATKCSSCPGIPVRTISCAGNNERTARRMTQHHVRMRKDVWASSICATLSNVKLLATPLTSPRMWADCLRSSPALGSEERCGFWSDQAPAGSEAPLQNSRL